MATLPTVRVACPDNKRAGYAVINESDFDPSVHTLWGDVADAPGDPASMTKAALVAEAKAQGIKGAARMNKVTLLEVLYGEG